MFKKHIQTSPSLSCGRRRMYKNRVFWRHARGANLKPCFSRHSLRGSVRIHENPEFRSVGWRYDSAILSEVTLTGDEARFDKVSLD